MRNDLHANLTVRIFTDRKCFGPGVAELLRRVRELHSLRAAAMSMNMAYSKAWKLRSQRPMRFITAMRAAPQS